MSMSSGSGDAPQQPARINFGYIGDAWRIITGNMGVWVVAGLLYLLISGAVSSPEVVTVTSGGAQQLDTRVNVTSGLNGLISSALNAFLMAGMFRMAFKQLRGQAVTVGDLFSGKDVFFPVWGAHLLTSFGIGIGAVFCVLPGLLLAALWQFTVPLIVDKKMGITEAMSLSWRTVQPHLWSVLGYLIVAALCTIAGAFLCGIGLIFTIPILPLATTMLYRDFFPDISAEGPSPDMN